MASYTTNLNLEMPTVNEKYDVLKVNQNWQKIDNGYGAINSQIGATYNTTVTVTTTGNTALKRIHNQWSNVVSAIKAAHGLTTSTGMVNITGRAEFPANGTASALGTYFYWGVLNCSNEYGTMYLYQYHNSPLYIYRNHGTTADGSTVNETAADIT